MPTDNTCEITLDTRIISEMHFFLENIGKYCSRSKNWQELIIKNGMAPEFIILVS